MTIQYCGQIKGEKHNTRCAWIEYNEKEETLFSRILNLMHKVTTWDASLFDGIALINVYDREEYEEFKDWYKEAKKMFTQCMKYGF